METRKNVAKHNHISHKYFQTYTQEKHFYLIRLRVATVAVTVVVAAAAAA